MFSFDARPAEPFGDQAQTFKLLEKFRVKKKLASWLLPVGWVGKGLRP
jgi:hypothetical protein